VVVVAGDTGCVPDAATLLTPWSMEMEVAPVTSHDKFVESPAGIDEGLLLNDVITGTVTGPEGVSGCGVSACGLLAGAWLAGGLDEGNLKKFPFVAKAMPPTIIISIIAPSRDTTIAGEPFFLGAEPVLPLPPFCWGGTGPCGWLYAGY
jgi:hypothetical protein